jgi:hypothetical protein
MHADTHGTHFTRTIQVLIQNEHSYALCGGATVLSSIALSDIPHSRFVSKCKHNFPTTRHCSLLPTALTTQPTPNDHLQPGV